MGKSLYSLMLSDEVMHEIDALAHKMGTNRSNMVNMILAEKAEIKTPEQRINDIFSGMEQLLATSRELVPFFTPHTQRVAVRSSLQYKYHPTLRYDVELASAFSPGKPIGMLIVSFRTQSQALLELLDGFFRCLCGIEERMLPLEISYTFGGGRFTRTLAYPESRSDTGRRTADSGDISRAITDYVSIVDKMLKACVGGADIQTLAEMYSADLDKKSFII